MMIASNERKVVAVVILVLLAWIYSLLPARAQLLSYNVMHDVTVEYPDKTCKVWVRYNELGFKADVIECTRSNDDE